MASDIHFDKELGSGAVAKVFKVKYKNEECAAKVIRAMTKDMRKTLIKESKVLRNLSHKNIIKVLDFLEHKDTLILELCGIEIGSEIVIDVKEWARHCQKIKNQTIDFKVIDQVVNGIEYLHKNNVIHCDLKSANCLVKGAIDAPVVKVADFGIAYFQMITETETLNSQESIKIKLSLAESKLKEDQISMVL